MLVKILGGIDALAGLCLLSLAFGLNLPSDIFIVLAVLLILKGLFVFTGAIVPGIMDFLAATVLILSIYYTIPIFILVLSAFLLFQKGFLSFL